MKNLRVLILVAVALATLGVVSSSQAYIGVSVGFAPPPLVAYEPPPVPGPGYMWTPGYWAWDPIIGSYYWVPGYWVRPPSIGLYWTPAWWGYDNGLYVFHDGYWGSRVGWYGGINYGYGYFGDGYYGGRWDGGTFAYNTAVYRVNKTVINNYYVDRTVLAKQTTTTRASYNGPGGVQAKATAEQLAVAETAKKAGPTSDQLERRQAAAKDPKLQAKANNGHVKSDAVKEFDKTHGHAQGMKGEGAAAATETTKGAAGGETAENAKAKGALKADTAKGTGAERAESAKGARADREAGARSTDKKALGGPDTKTKTAHERGGTQKTEHAGRARGAEHREATTLRSTNRGQNYGGTSHRGGMFQGSRQTQINRGRAAAGGGNAVTAGGPQKKGQQQQEERKKKPNKGPGGR